MYWTVWCRKPHTIPALPRPFSCLEKDDRTPRALPTRVLSDIGLPRGRPYGQTEGRTLHTCPIGRYNYTIQLKGLSFIGGELESILRQKALLSAAHRPYYEWTVSRF